MPRAGEQEPPLLRGLLPAREPAPALEVVESLGMFQRADATPARPRVVLNMLASLDGRITHGGRSGGLGGPADRALFHALRASADAVLAGAQTVRAERYGRMVPDAGRRAGRAARGMPEEPLACVVSASLDLSPELPLLAEPDARVVVLTGSEGELSPTRARVEYIRADRDGRLDLGLALERLAERFGVQLVVCEGGPRLARALLAAGLLDEMFLSLSPVLLAGEGLRALAGAELEPPSWATLLGVLEADSYLFLRYGVSALERVSRETTSSSSLER